MSNLSRENVNVALNNLKEVINEQYDALRANGVDFVLQTDEDVSEDGLDTSNIVECTNKNSGASEDCVVVAIDSKGIHVVRVDDNEKISNLGINDFSLESRVVIINMIFDNE